MSFVIFLVLIAAIVLYAVGIYNSLVNLRNRVKNAFAQIDVQLTRRYDLIPNLIEAVKGYMKHERTAAAYAAPVFGRVVGHDPQLPGDAWPPGVARLDDLRELFRLSDAVTLHLPLTAETRGLVGGALLAEMITFSAHPVQSG